LNLRYGISIAVAVIVCLLNSLSSYGQSIESTTPTAEELRAFEWQRNFNGSSDAYHRKDYAEAEKLGNAAVKIAEGFSPSDHRLLTTLHNLVLVYEDQAKWSSAEKLHMRCLEVAKGNASKTSEIYCGLSRLYARQGNKAKSDDMLTSALASAESGPSSITSNSSFDLMRLGRLYQHAKKYEKAEQLFLKALKSEENSYGSDHPIVSHSLLVLAKLYLDQGKPADAEPLCKRAIGICERQTPCDDFDLGIACNMYAQVLEKLDKVDDAKLMFERSEKLMPTTSSH
jgi:tetratricopeptide (TPR) repeat protein